MPFSIIAAAVSNDIESGRTTRRSDCMTRTSEYAPGAPPEYATRSPTLTWVTPAPIASTTPAPSLPIPEGRAILYSPERWYTSRKLSPQALWRTRASPGPGSPTCTSSHLRTSGPPCCWMRIAFGISSPRLTNSNIEFPPRSYKPGLFFRWIILRLPCFGGLPHCCEAGFLHFQALNGRAQNVEIHVEPVLHQFQLRDAPFDLVLAQGRGHHSRGRQSHRAPQVFQELERVGRLIHEATRRLEFQVYCRGPKN